LRSGGGLVDPQKIGDARIAEIAWDNPHHEVSFVAPPIMSGACRHEERLPDRRFESGTYWQDGPPQDG
jgi:hypothetical protein